MKPDYKNWVPKMLIIGMAAAAMAFLAAFLLLGVWKEAMQEWLYLTLSVVFAAAFLGCGKTLQWSIRAYSAFSYDGKRQLSRAIIEGTASYVALPEGGVGLDVGCGSGALTIACAKRNPHGRMVGLDRWGKDYAEFSLSLCQRNAGAEGVENVSFRQGDAGSLPFPDESFDAVTSNYVYHNITGVDKQQLLLETLRVLKKGGTFAIHDLMSRRRYGDMQAFMQQLREMGFEEVRLIDTADGMFMSRREGRVLMLQGSSLLVGKK